ncbi:MAG: Rab family GTPase [Candidatus Helarchaeota archaeon]
MVLFGNEAVGKTSLVQKYINNRFEEEYISTLGYNVFEKTLEFDGYIVTLMIFDIGGQERFEELRKQYAYGARAAFLVYDITNRFSFENIRKWYNDLRKFTEVIAFVLVGNKLDLNENRQVEEGEGVRLAQELYADDFFETSAKTGQQVEMAFYKLSQILLEKSVGQKLF